ncbi:MAG TPA: hypothetical protein VGQ55_01895 [Pyrinomonadaceae bacterium]|jgi:hypothetical protein|nr:hypothetical protein [Pyrinomonadaceae bacterium]
MKGKHIKWIVASVVFLGIVGVIVYQFSGGRMYSSDLKALRAEFNRNKGKPRLLVLLSPT